MRFSSTYVQLALVSFVAAQSSTTDAYGFPVAVTNTPTGPTGRTTDSYGFPVPTDTTIVPIPTYGPSGIPMPGNNTTRAPYPYSTGIAPTGGSTGSIPITRNTTFSSATLQPTTTRTTSLPVDTTTAPAPTDTSTGGNGSNSASGLDQQIALAFGAVAALLFLN